MTAVVNLEASTRVRGSAALVLAMRGSGPVVPGYDDDPDIPLDLNGLRLVERLISPDGVDPATLEDGEAFLLEALRIRGTIIGQGASDHPAPDRPVEAGAVADRAIDPAQEVVLPTPGLVGCGTGGGFEFVAHDGSVLLRLDARELMATSVFRIPANASAARTSQAALLGPHALSDAEFEALFVRLVRARVVIPYDPNHPEQARLTRQASTMRDHMQRRVKVLQNFDREEAERDEAGGPADRVRVNGFHTSWSGLPASLGMIIAGAKGYEDGVLEQHYDFRPRLLWDQERLEQACAGSPSIFLFSNYVWSTVTNLTHSALVKQLSPHHLTVHGGPDSPKYPGDAERFFADNPHIDVIVNGEGEATFADMLCALRGHIGDGPPDLSVLGDVPGLAFRHGDRVVQTGGRDRIADLDTIPSPVLTGLYDSFIPAGKGPGGLNLETNRGCPYGCTFCDWGSATLSRIRKFSLDRVFAELEWCAVNGFKVAIADANFGIFERDVDIAERIAELKATYGYPRFVGNNYAKNTVKHLSKIIDVFTEAGIVAEGKMSMQSFDTETLHTIRRKNIKVEKYHELSVEFRRNGLPMSVDLMMGLPGATVDAFRNDLQACIDRDLRAIVHATVLLPNSPMNEPEYREENGIVAVPGEEVRESASFTRADWEHMHMLRWGYWLFENFGVLRQVGSFVRSETGMREVDFYEQLVETVHADRERWPTMAVTLLVLPQLMVPPVSWQRFMEEVREYLLVEVGLPADDALDTVLAVQHALQPARDRQFPVVLDLPHDYAAWHAAISELRDDGRHRDWNELAKPLREFGPATFRVDDPLDSCQRHLGPSFAFLSEDSAWDLASPVSRPRQALMDAAEQVAV